MDDSHLLKRKTIDGLFWSFADLMAGQGIQFMIQIILARLLLPEHFGIIGMILVIIAISNSIVDSGFSQALIRDQNTSQEDYSTVFHFNIIIGIVIFIFLFFSANAISSILKQPQVVIILRILSLVLIINSFGIIPKVMLIKKVDFKTITKVSVIASISSGVITITFASMGYGIWCLVINIVSMQLFQTMFLWIFTQWIPSMVFKMKSFKKFFRFGYKLLISGLIDTFYNNIYFLIIGGFYNTTQLGYYTNAVKFRDFASQSIAASVQRVSYPILSSVQGDEERLKAGFRKIIKTSAFINFPLMIGLASIANPLFNIFLGEKWVPSVIYFQLLCISGMLYPLHSLNLNILQVKGRSDLFLLIEIFKKTVLTILIALSLLLELGILGLIGSAVLNSYLSLLINTYYSSKAISYSMKDQMMDLLPHIMISIIMGIVVFNIGLILPFGDLMKLIVQIISGILIYITCSKIAKIKELIVLYEIFKVYVLKFKLKLKFKSKFHATK